MKGLTIPDRYVFVARIAWVALRLIAVLWMARPDMHFYYQGF